MLFKPWVIAPNWLSPFPLLFPLYNKNKVFALRIRLTTGYFNMPQQPLSLPFTSCHVSISTHVNQSYLSFIKYGSNIYEINIILKEILLKGLKKKKNLKNQMFSPVKNLTSSAVHVPWRGSSVLCISWVSLDVIVAMLNIHVWIVWNKFSCKLTEGKLELSLNLSSASSFLKNCLVCMCVCVYLVKLNRESFFLSETLCCFYHLLLALVIYINSAVWGRSWFKTIYDWQ